MANLTEQNEQLLADAVIAGSAVEVGLILLAWKYLTPRLEWRVTEVVLVLGGLAVLLGVVHLADDVWQALRSRGVWG